MSTKMLISSQNRLKLLCRKLAFHSQTASCSTSPYIQAVHQLADRGDIYNTNPPQLLTPNRQENEKYWSTMHENKCAYLGFDPTGDSLHLGSLRLINTSLALAKQGWKIIYLIGGATARLGDPTGRTTDRPAMSEETTKANAESITQQISQIVQLCQNKHDTELSTQIVDNREWYDSMNVIEYLADDCRMIRVNQMLSRSAVKERLANDGMSFAEFAYQTMQAHDWLQLYRRYKCTTQLGGQDQAGNMHTGFLLLRSVYGNEVHPTALTVPLLTNSDGAKLGKSNNDGMEAMWLSAKRTTPFALYQQLKQTPDDKAKNMLLHCTMMSKDEIEELCQSSTAWHAQTALARDVVSSVHGMSVTDSVERCSRVLYAKGNATDLTEQDLKMLSCELPNVEIIERPTWTVDELVRELGFFPPKNVEDMIKKGAVSINGVKLENVSDVLNVSRLRMFSDLPLTLVRRGKRNYSVIRWI